MPKIEFVISEGVALGEVKKIQFTEASYNNSFTTVDHEISLFSNALINSINSLTDIINNSSILEKNVLDVHLMILNDPNMKKKVIDHITNNKVSAENSVCLVLDKYLENLKKTSNEYL
ncbi:MAG: phosphoenolpyruvate-utilizing N-terminal domain-containing protein, partial [Anaeroplasmataceae bacterium]